MATFFVRDFHSYVLAEDGLWTVQFLFILFLQNSNWWLLLIWEVSSMRQIAQTISIVQTNSCWLSCSWPIHQTGTNALWSRWETRSLQIRDELLKADVFVKSLSCDKIEELWQNFVILFPWLGAKSFHNWKHSQRVST